MLHIIICTEGSSSEPNAIESAVNCLRGQAPHVYSQVEVVPVSLGGNHGHTKLIEVAERKIKEYTRQFVEETDELERFLICDYDNLDKAGVDLQRLRKDADKHGFRLLMTKPKFEYFIARHFFTAEELRTTTPAALAGKIQEGINRYNATQPAALQIPDYSKQYWAAERCLGTLYNLDPNFLRMACNIEIEPLEEKGQFTEIPILFKRLMELFLD